MLRYLITVLAALLSSFGGVQSADFRFSQVEQEERAQQAQQQSGQQVRIADLLHTPCAKAIKNSKILVLFGEYQNGVIQAGQTRFNPYFDVINSRLRSLGLRTYTQAQIKQQVAQAEIDAYFRNDPDAALNASRRLAARYIFKGLISTETRFNPAINVNQVAIRMNFNLTDANGKLISQADAENASYSGPDTTGMTLTLINERADEVVASLYADHCKKSGVR